MCEKYLCIVKTKLSSKVDVIRSVTKYFFLRKISLAKITTNKLQCMFTLVYNTLTTTTLHKT